MSFSCSDFVECVEQLLATRGARTVKGLALAEIVDSPDPSTWSGEESLCVLAERVGQVLDDRRNLLRALGDSLTAWEGEEDSVKEEHAELIENLRAAIAQATGEAP